MTFEQMNESAPESVTPEHQDGLDESGMELDPALGGAKPGNKNMMVVFGLLVVGAGVVWFMFFRSGPQSAQAVTPPGGGTEIKQFLDGGNITQMKQTLKDTEKLVQQFRAYPGNTQVPLASLRTNPFRELEPNNDAPKKNDDEEVKEHAKVVNAVSELHLQSIMRGSKHRSCMINNTLYAEGQQVGIFTVKQVTTSTVVIESGKYRFELKMQN